MSLTRRVLARPLTVALIAALAIATLPASSAKPVRAATAELFFSEYVEGTGNSKALEIFNGTGAPVDASAYALSYYFNGATTPLFTLPLSGTIATDDVQVIAQAAADAAVLAVADITSAASWFNGDDAVVLSKGTTTVDVIGVIGSDPGTEWGVGLVSTADNTIRRKVSILAGDANAADAFDPAHEA